MPIIKSAKKALRQTKKRAILNRAKKESAKKALKAVKGSRISNKLGAFFSSIDRAVMSGVVHKNKARRLKSKASKLVFGISEPVIVKAKVLRGKKKR